MALVGVAPLVRRWLEVFGQQPPASDDADEGGCALLDWAASGAMSLTGRPDGPPELFRPALLPLLASVGAAIADLTERLGDRVDIDPAVLLTGRAGAAGLARQGQGSAGGATRLLRSADGWCAVTMARAEDVELVPAIVGRPAGCDPWQDIAVAARHATGRRFTDHVQRFGVPAAALPAVRPDVAVPWSVTTIASPRSGLRLDGAVVVDLSSLWAGPLCAQLLGRAGATVIKVESTSRPDGARMGNSAFFDWLHAGHQSVAVDFTTAAGRAALADLVRAADVVIEASRPRALANLGLAPEALDHRAGKVWLSITGYGRREPARVAFGDDAAVAGGLVGWSGEVPVFCADAIADPLTGVLGALAVAASCARGGGHLIDLAMRDVAAVFAEAPPVSHRPHRLWRAGSDWLVECAHHGGQQAVLPPRPPRPTARAAPIGADTERVLGAPRGLSSPDTAPR
jgi:crotonobetainyl-CoA:carnitine CoA-transferase CaiB-like acyl-CoA transferase